MRTILYDWGGANTWLFYAVNGWHSDALDAIMQFGTLLGDHNRFPLYLAIVALVGWWRTTQGAPARPWLSVLAVFALAYVVDGALVGWLKDMLDFPRPPAALPPETVHIVGTPEFKRGLPSGHAVFAATCAASLWPLLNCAARIIAALFVVWVAWSRIALGVHFPADVVAGALLAVTVVIVIQYALNLAMLKLPPSQRRR